MATPYSARFLFNRETGISMVGWMLFLAGASLYCLLYNQLVLVTPSSFMNSFVWSLREYAVWLVITPALYSGLRQIHTQTTPHIVQRYSLLMGAALLLVLTLHVAMDTHTQYPSTFANVVDIFPTQLSVLCFLVAVWHLFFRRLDRQAISHNITNSDSNDHGESVYDNVKVMKGNGEAWVSWASVDFISAAGNYMELSCGAEKYLLRITLKELEQQLPSQQFIRVHRSHIVNIAAIRRIGSHNGNGFVELRNQHIVPLSKGYKPALDAVPFTLHPSHH